MTRDEMDALRALAEKLLLHDVDAVWCGPDGIMQLGGEGILALLSEIERKDAALRIAIPVLSAYGGEGIIINNGDGPDFEAMNALFAMASALGDPEADVDAMMATYAPVSP